MVHYDEIPDVDKVRIRCHLSALQFHLTQLSIVPSCNGLYELYQFKEFVDTELYLSDEVPF